MSKLIKLLSIIAIFLINRKIQLATRIISRNRHICRTDAMQRQDRRNNMNLEKLLAYQEEDRKVWVLENKLRSSEEMKKMDENAKENARAKEELLSSSRRTDDLFHTVIRFNDEIKKIAAEIGDIVDTVDDFEELREIDLYEKKVNQLTKLIEANEREIRNITRELDEIEKNYKNLLKLALHTQNEYKKYKDSYDAKKKELSVEAKQCITSREKLAVEIDPNVLAQYKAIRSAKMPVVVPLNGKSCFCGMELDMSALAKLDSEGIAHCPNCSRIVYKK